MTISSETKDKIAAWWAERFQIEDKREAFRLGLRQLLDETPEQEWSTLHVDYDPFGILLDAVRDAGVPCRGNMFSADGILPAKTRMYIYSENNIQTREGYGADFEVLK